MNFLEVIELVQDDLELVNKELLSLTKSDIPLINQVADYIINSGGKRVRPLLTLLFARMLELEDFAAAVKIATVTELIHTATILHDDVVDDSSFRRNRPTANRAFNNPAAVLVGDFIYTRAFQLIADFKNPELMSLYTDAVNVISEGEVKQLTNLGDLSINEEKYFDVIYSKTARLFEVCCHAVAMLKYPDQPAKQLKLAKFGVYLGTAFQIIDDLIDYTSDDHKSGKARGDDLAEGKPTLPLLHLRQVGTEADKQLVEDIILQKKGREVLDEVVARMEAHDSFAYCTQRAHQEADKARAALEDVAHNDFKEALLTLLQMSLSRDN